MSQAISFRRQDSIQASGSPTASSLSRWRASPLSFKMGSLVGSLGTKLYHAPGCSPMSALDTTDFMMPAIGSFSSSLEQSRLLQALSTSTDGGDTSNYTCCGMPLNDLHALLDHFEESHVLVLDHHTLNQHQLLQQQLALQTQQLHTPEQTHTHPSLNEDMPLGSMELDPVDADLEESPSASGSSSSSSSSSSPHLGPSHNLSSNMNPYYADFRSLMAAGGASPISSNSAGGVAAPSSLENPSSSSAGRNSQAQCIPPALLFSPAPSPTPSRRQSTLGAAPAVANASPNNSTGVTSGATAETSPIPNSDDQTVASTSAITVSGPGIIHPGPPPPNTAPTSLAKPFKCPTPNCNKSYKQANGLKYHLQHGQCCFIPKDPALEGLDELEKDRVERPFGCGVGGCERRYKNMNGLRYHYQHSGAHGVKGLELLNAGLHSVQLAAASAAKANRSGGHSRSSSIGLNRAGSTASNLTSQDPPSSPIASEPNTPSGLTRTATTNPSGISRAVGAVAGSQGPIHTEPSTPQSAAIKATGLSTVNPASQPAVFPYAQYCLQYPPNNGTTMGGFSSLQQRQAVFPPTHPQVNPGLITSTIAAMAGAFGATYHAAQTSLNAQQQLHTLQCQPQRPHQLLRTNSSGAVAPATAVPTIGTTPVNVTNGPISGDVSGDIDMDMEMAMEE